MESDDRKKFAQDYNRSSFVEQAGGEAEEKEEVQDADGRCFFESNAERSGCGGVGYYSRVRIHLLSAAPPAVLFKHASVEAMQLAW